MIQYAEATPAPAGEYEYATDIVARMAEDCLDLFDTQGCVEREALIRKGWRSGSIDRWGEAAKEVMVRRIATRNRERETAAAQPIIRRGVEVYARTECVFAYCPEPALCRAGDTCHCPTRVR